MTSVYRRLATMAFAFSAFAACSFESQTSQSLDIFTQDEDGQRRRKAQGEELFWTIDMGGCTGHLISPEYMMTANHCSPRAGASYRSGASIASGGGRDITVEQVVEQSGQLDYAILKIRWNGTRPENQKFPPKVATQASDLQMGTASEQGDEIFTVGFPGDTRSRWGATYAEGRAKRPYGDLLQYNIGIINGNSGGGVWRKSDGMLVSLTNGGPSMLGQPGWNNNDKNDSGHWNHGAAMWNVYARSNVLKDIFPNGVNRFADQTNTNQNQVPELFLAIGKEDAGAADAFTLHVSAPSSVASIVLCEGQSACSQGATGYTATSRDGATGDRNLHKSNAAVALSAGATWSITALDANGQSLGFKAIRFQQR